MEKYKHVPQELKAMDQWVCYKLVWSEKKQKHDKIPKNPHTGRNAKSNDIKTWGSYEEAIEAEKKYKFDGLGFQLGNGVFGVDLDHMYQGGEFTDQAKEIIKTLSSYTEFSPSGDGVHILCKGEIPPKDRKKGNVEMYQDKRYLTVTGNAIKPIKPLEERTKEAAIIHKKYLSRDEPRQPQAIPQEKKQLELSEAEIISKALNSKNGDKFSRLWNGDISNHPTQSEADFALVNHLTYWTNGDAVKIDNLFRQSQLMRDKWDKKHGRDTYGNLTIEAALKDFTPYIKKDYSIHIKNAEGGQPSGANGNTVINNYTTPEGFTTEKEPLGIFKTPKGYRYGVPPKGKDGEYYIKPITNFYINVKEMIRTDEETILRCELTGNDGRGRSHTVEKDLNVKDFDNKRNFLEAIGEFKFFFKGNEENLQDIKFLESKTEYSETIGVNHVGFSKVDGKEVFITNTKAVDSDLRPLNDVTILDHRVQVKSDILEHEPITPQELETLAPYLFSFNSLEVTASILGTLTIMLLKSKLADHQDQVRAKHLVIYGESGAGKSETREYLIDKFLGLGDKDHLNCNNITQFSLNKFFESSNCFPVVLEEYKPWKMRPQNVDAISDCLRNSYDSASGIRGTKTQGLIRYPMQAPAILIGEEGQDETAIKERSMIVNLSKMASRSGNRETNFIWLKKNGHLLSKLGRSVLNQIIKTDINRIIEKREKIKGNNLATLTDNRVNDTVINAILGINLIGEIFKEHNLNFEKATGVKVNDIVTAINQNCFIEILDENTQTKTIIDRMIELIDTMAGKETLHPGIHYQLINDNEQIALFVPLLFDELTKYKREHDIKEETLTTKNQFTKQLRKTSYYDGYKAVKFKDIYSETLTVRKSHVLNIAPLEERGIDLNFIV